MPTRETPAFPQTSPIHEGGEGLSIRDYFAGQALACVPHGLSENVAKACYDLADAMLKERKERKEARFHDP